MSKFLIALTLLFVASPVSANTATYYGNEFVGRRMANGKIYNHSKMVAASNRYRLGTRVKVTNLRNKKSVTVTITDRCGNCYIDLSRSAFSKIANTKLGRVPVSVKRL
jgi:rare lipoprotein A